MTSEQIGRVVGGRYRLVSRLAVGGMGVTYRAWDLRLGSPVVLKMPRRPSDDPDGAEFATLAARFVREIEAMRALAHDYIVPIVDHGVDEGTPFVAMRFLPGGSLADDRKPGPGGEWQPVAAGLLHFWLPSIASALDFMHGRGVVHRDVKPANIFFDGFRNSFLGDFGIAKVVGDEAGLEKGQTLTATHLAIGTPEYMAPELLSPRTQADGRADQYALAISVYELLAGHRPLTGSTAHIVVEHATLPPPRLDARRLNLPVSLVGAIELALAKRPGERFASCREFAEAALAGVTPEPNDPSVVRLLCPGCRKVLRVPAAAGGRRGNCPSCKQFVEIADDFSALWLTSEAALVAEPPPPSGSVPILGLIDGGDSQPEASEASSEPVAAAVGRRWSLGAMAASAGVAAVLAATAAGLTTHLVWAGRHGQVTQAKLAERQQEQAAHAEAVEEIRRAGAAAVATAEQEWQAKLTDAKQAWEKEEAAAEQARLAREEQARLEAARRAEAKVAEERAAAAKEAAARKAAAMPPFRELTNSIGIKMLLIQAGKFVMGEVRNGPAHEVTLTKPFYLGVTEVTNAQWKAVMGEIPSDENAPDHPVERVGWEDVVGFCEKLSALSEERKAGRVYRLPTEAEWEYACRAGTKTAYSFGDDENLLGDVAWFEVNADRRTHPVGKKKPNPWGLYDMHGNAFEWVSDWYHAFPNYPVRDPSGPARGSSRVRRGGSWNHPAGRCRSAHRHWGDPSDRYGDLGFRLALSPAEASQPSEPGMTVDD